MRYIWALLLVVALFEIYRLSLRYASVGHFVRANFATIETLSDLNHWLIEGVKHSISSATGLG